MKAKRPVLSIGSDYDHCSKPSVERVKYHLQWLTAPISTRDQRLMHWRGVIEAAHTGFEVEVQELDALNSVMADPTLDVGFVG